MAQDMARQGTPTRGIGIEKGNNGRSRADDTKLRMRSSHYWATANIRRVPFGSVRVDKETVSFLKKMEN